MDIISLTWHFYPKGYDKCKGHCQFSLKKSWSISHMTPEEDLPILLIIVLYGQFHCGDYCFIFAFIWSLRMDHFSIISGAFTKKRLTWLKIWPFGSSVESELLLSPQQAAITLFLITRYMIFFCFLQEACSDCPQPWSSPHCGSCQWGCGQLILQYSGMTGVTWTLSPLMERVPPCDWILCPPTVFHSVLCMCYGPQIFFFSEC